VSHAARAPLVALVALGGILTGCFGGKNSDARCDDVSEYQLAGSVPPVVAPDGLAAPSRGSGYVVPPLEGNPEVDGAACLARPPDYFRKEAAAPPTP
jgi:uncharacterized lipoprotein